MTSKLGTSLGRGVYYFWMCICACAQAIAGKFKHVQNIQYITAVIDVPWLQSRNPSQQVRLAFWQTAPLEPSPQTSPDQQVFARHVKPRGSHSDSVWSQALKSKGLCIHPWGFCPKQESADLATFAVRASKSPSAGKAGGSRPILSPWFQEGDCQILFQNIQNYFVPYYSLLPGPSPTCPHLGSTLTPSRAGYSLSICRPLSVWPADREQMVLIGCMVTDKEELGLSLEPLSWQLLHEAYRYYLPICLFGCTDIKEQFSWKRNCGTSSSSTLHTSSCEDPLAKTSAQACNPSM